MSEGFLRPKYTILPDEALVPESNRVDPPPEHFTHELIRPQPFRFDGARPTGEPDGVLPAGTKVALLSHQGRRCRVVDERGLSVEIDHESLKRL